MKMWRRFRAWLSRLFRRRPRPLTEAEFWAAEAKLAELRTPATFDEQLEQLATDGRWGGDLVVPTFDPPPILRRERRPGMRARRGLRR